MKSCHSLFPPISMDPFQLVLGAFYVLRIFNTLIPQHGYIHPDEFFQFTEPVVGDMLSIKHLRTWEFQTDHPIRSMLSPIIISSFLCFLKYLYIPLSPYLLLVLPRLMFTLLSFVVDLCIYKMCGYMKIDHFWPLLTFASSYITLTYMTHTFTNSLEMIYLSLTLLIVVKSREEKKRLHTNQLGFLMALAIFNRPTFITFTFAPIIIWCSLGTNSFLKMIENGLPICKSFMVTSLALVLVDTFYYEPDIHIFLAVSILCTLFLL